MPEMELGNNQVHEEHRTDPNTNENLNGAQLSEDEAAEIAKGTGIEQEAKKQSGNNGPRLERKTMKEKLKDAAKHTPAFVLGIFGGFSSRFVDKDIDVKLLKQELDDADEKEVASSNEQTANYLHDNEYFNYLTNEGNVALKFNFHDSPLKAKGELNKLREMGILPTIKPLEKDATQGDKDLRAFKIALGKRVCIDLVSDKEMLEEAGVPSEEAGQKAIDAMLKRIHRCGELGVMVSAENIESMKLIEMNMRRAGMVEQNVEITAKDVEEFIGGRGQINFKRENIIAKIEEQIKAGIAVYNISANGYPLSVTNIPIDEDNLPGKRNKRLADEERTQHGSIQTLDQEIRNAARQTEENSKVFDEIVNANELEGEEFDDYDSGVNTLSDDDLGF